ncbi:Uncharacterised protein [Segatella copri]|nr:Uncharacterised protein [Segatella copri]
MKHSIIINLFTLLYFLIIILAPDEPSRYALSHKKGRCH